MARGFLAEQYNQDLPISSVHTLNRKFGSAMATKQKRIYIHSAQNKQSKESLILVSTSAE